MQEYVVQDLIRAKMYMFQSVSDDAIPPFGHFVVADPRVADDPADQNLFGAVVFARLKEGRQVTYHGYIQANLGQQFGSKMLFSVKPGEPLVYSTPDGGQMRSSNLGFPGHRRVFGPRNRISYGRFFSEEQRVLHGVLRNVMRINWFDGDDSRFDVGALPYMPLFSGNGVPFHGFELGGDMAGSLGVAFGAAGIPHWSYWISCLKDIESTELDQEFLSPGTAFAGAASR